MQLPQDFPVFVYHPDPVATGSVTASAAECVCCGRSRGFVYQGPVYSTADVPRGRLCPWCIADGSAADRFDAHFTDIDAQQQIGEEAAALIDRRTPGFSAWQQERWLVHCGDGAAFLGPAGARELARHPMALESLRAQLAEGRWPQDQIEHYLQALDKHGQPTAYLFACRHCGTHLAYSDST